MQPVRVGTDHVVDQAIDMIDGASDQMGKRFLSDRLPPALMEEEEEMTAEGKTAAFEVGRWIGGTSRWAGPDQFNFKFCKFQCFVLN